MAALNFKTLKEEYDNFHYPIIELKVDDKVFSENKKGLGLSDVTVDLTAGFEASQAVYTLYNVYDTSQTEFLFSNAKDFITLGSSVRLYIGYNNIVREVFRGLIVKVNFTVERNEMPGIVVTAMDMKCVMMANNYNRQLKAKSYSGAIKEIFDQSVYQTLLSNSIVSEYTVGATPDDPAGDVPGASGAAGAAGGVSALSGAASGGAANPALQGLDLTTEKSIEMVAESDYEFVVKVAKKFNYEFYVTVGQVLFRKAKDDTTTLIELDGTAPIRLLNVEYDITGLYGKVEVRGLDPGNAKIVSVTLDNKNKISTANKAKEIVSGNKYVYVDSTVLTKDDAKNRAQFLMEDMSYRFGTLELVLVGLPDIIPGRFIVLNDIGKAVSNKFYVYAVRHVLDGEGNFTTRVLGRAAKLTDDLAGAAGDLAGGVGGASSAIGGLF